MDALLVNLDSGVHTTFPMRMQRLFPEGEAFTFALYGSANCNASAWATLEIKKQRIAEAEWALEQLYSDDVKSRFPELLPPGYGMYYAGWCAYLQGRILEVKGSANCTAEERHAFIQKCDTLAATFVQHTTPFPESYNGMAWPGDAMIGMAALAVHDRILPDRYANVRRLWVQRVRRTIAENSGIAHEWDPATNSPKKDMRGSSLALSCMVLPSIDPTLAKEQFAVFSHRFFDEILGVPVVNEFPSKTNGKGDVDSGPLIFGAGPVSMIVGAGACRVNGDAFHDLELNSTVDGFGFPLGTSDRNYVFGVMPIADLFIAWCRSQPIVAPLVRPIAKFLRFHCYSLGLLVLLWLPVIWCYYRRNN